MTTTAHRNAPIIREMAQTVSALGLALLLTLATLGAMNHLANGQYGAQGLARAAAGPQAQALTPAANRS